MKISTKNSLIGKLLDITRINENFNRYEEVNFNPKSKIISPVEAKVAYTGKIINNKIISKNNKQIKLNELIGNYDESFNNGSYINFYLNPKNKHFWITPSEGEFIYTQKNEGKSTMPVFIGLENLFGVECLSKAVKKNASIGSIYKTNDSLIAMIAVGSLNVNRINVDYKENKNYPKGVPCGYFSLGSSMILCFQKDKGISINQDKLVKIGERLK